MAEIKIEKKQKWWPWVILGLGILIAISCFFLLANNVNVEEPLGIQTDEHYRQGELSANSPPKPDPEVTGYSTFTYDTSKLGVDAQYTNTALVQLSQAVRQAAMEHNLEIKGRLESGDINTRESADSLQLSGKLKRVGGQIAEIIQELQQGDFPQLAHQSQEINDAVASIDPRTTINLQKDNIRTFFESCGDALQEMNAK
jgi:hypothetical protein